LNIHGTCCTNFARIDVHFRALFCLHLPNEFIDLTGRPLIL
jgi:hypothetical protein